MTAPHLLHVFSTFVPAGPETRTVNLIEALGREFRHSILAIDGRTDARALLSGRAEVAILPEMPRAGSFATLKRLRALLRELNPDLSLSYNWGAFDAVLAARTLRRPHVHHEDGFTSDETQTFKRRRVWARRLFLGGTERVIVPSQRLATIARDTWKLAPDHVRYIPNGIDVARFPPRDGNRELRAQLGIAPDALVIGWVGHLRPEKNPQRFLQSCARIDRERNVILLVLGDGPERAACEALAEKLQPLFGRVRFAGHQPDPAPYYRAMDAFVISSDTEQMPVALLEAMASALPVVSTEVGDVRSMLPEAQGPFVVPLAERESAWPLAEALDRLLDAAPLRTSLGAANRRRVEESFSFERMLTAYREVYRAALKLPPPPLPRLEKDPRRR